MKRAPGPPPTARRAARIWGSVPEALDEVGHVDRVELKALVDCGLERALTVLGDRVGPPRTRRVHYLDTPDLALHRRGVIVRARITDRSCEGVPRTAGDVVVKLRRPSEESPPRSSRLDLELDALPVQTAWAASIKRRVEGRAVERALVRRRPARTLLGKQQRRLLRRLAGDDVDTDQLAVFGPVDVVRFTSGPPMKRIGVELWSLVDGSRLVEVFAKCHPRRSEAMAERIRDLIGDCGIPLAERQLSKTQASLDLLADAR